MSRATYRIFCKGQSQIGQLVTLLCMSCLAMKSNAYCFQFYILFDETLNILNMMKQKREQRNILQTSQDILGKQVMN